MKAANQGIVSAQLNLGIYYCNGIGVNKSEQNGKIWFEKAAEQGNELAKEYLEKYFK